MQLPPPPSAEQLFLLLTAGFSAAVLVHHLFAWAARVGARVHLWAWVWGAGALTWCLSRALLVGLGPARPLGAARWGELGLLALVPLAVGTVGVVGNARRGEVPDRFAGGALLTGLVLVGGGLLLVGVQPDQVQLRAGLGATTVVLAPGPGLLGFALVAVAALLLGLLRLVLRQGYDPYVRGMLVVGLLCWTGTLANDLLFAAGLVHTLPVHSHGLLVLGIVLTAALSAEARARGPAVDALIAEHHRNIEDQNRLLVQALAASRHGQEVRQRFLARVSHELRTPLHGILGMTELALDGAAEPARRYIEAAHRSAEELLQLVDDILDLSRAEAGRLRLAARSFPLAEFLEDTLRVLGPQAAAKDLDLLLDLPRDLPAVMVGDPLRLRQVLLNLVGNAVKFTEQGEVVLRVQVRGEGPATLRFEVADTGPGIPVEEQAHILEPFTQGAIGQGRGTGLGLSIAAELVRRMGGALQLDSAPGRGSRFSFELAYEPPEQTEEITLVDPVLLQGVRVLIAEDHAGTAEALDQELSSWRMYTRQVDRGDTALEELERARGEGRPYAVLLLDADVAGQDGWTVLRNLARHPGPAPAVVLMVAADTPANRFTRAVELGARAAIAKPIRAAELLEALLLAVGAGPDPRLAGPCAEAGEPAASLRVLVADDRQINRELARALLEGMGCEVELVEDGEPAVAAAVHVDFDLVLMDLSMPGMDGDTAARRIRQEEQRRGSVPVPIYALTAHSLPEIQDRLRAAGFYGVLLKPLRRAALEEVVERHRGSGAHAVVLAPAAAAQGEAAAPRDPPPAAPTPADDPADDPADAPLEDTVDEAAEPETDPGHGALDLVRLLSIVGGNEQLMVDLARLFLEELPGHEERLATAVQRAEAGAIARAAHALKGAASNLAAVDLYQAAALMEQAARADDVPAALRVWPELAGELRRVRPALARLMAEAGPG